MLQVGTSLEWFCLFGMSFVAHVWCATVDAWKPGLKLLLLGSARESPERFISIGKRNGLTKHQYIDYSGARGMLASQYHQVDP